jgi:hypothetical protein
LSFQQILQSISDTTTLDALWKAILAVYYMAWVFGTTIDVNFQEDVSMQAPNQGRLPLQAVGLLALFLVVAALLLYSQSYVQFVIFLSIFYVTNLIGYAYITKYFTNPMLSVSRGVYDNDKDYIGREKLFVVSHYMVGGWQVWRFLVGALIICAMAFIAVARSYFPQLLGHLGQLSPDLVQVLAMLCFVLVMEGWIWTMRLRTSAQLDILDELYSKYKIHAAT